MAKPNSLNKNTRRPPSKSKTSKTFKGAALKPSSQPSQPSQPSSTALKPSSQPSSMRKGFHSTTVVFGDRDRGSDRGPSDSRTFWAFVAIFGAVVVGGVAVALWRREPPFIVLAAEVPAAVGAELGTRSDWPPTLDALIAIDVGANVVFALQGTPATCGALVRAVVTSASGDYLSVTVTHAPEWLGCSPWVTAPGVPGVGDAVKLNLAQVQLVST